ncbi:rhomboid family intramembrane serine protease [Spongiimicrobium salis]|uniref:rhomboid family intramembrane serine protease n=1 Tax=Spongiimicrobium salis TaxID=1667022 RepID=UPI00374D210C
MLRITETVKHLIIINVLFWIATLTIGANGEVFNNLFALHFPKNDSFGIWQFFSHMFMHASYGITPTGGYGIATQHILYNMFALWMFGSAVEGAFGKSKFIFFYISAGLGGALLTLGIDYANFLTTMSDLSVGIDPNAMEEILAINSGNGEGYFTGENFFKYLRPIAETYNLALTPADIGTLFELNVINHKRMLGASGAISGIMAAFAFMFPNTRLFPIPLKAKHFIPLMFVGDLYFGFSGSGSGVAYFAHIGGALFGLFMVWYWKKNQFNNNRWN